MQFDYTGDMQSQCRKLRRLGEHAFHADTVPYRMPRCGITLDKPRSFAGHAATSNWETIE
jgi:hypothetical protein